MRDAIQSGRRGGDGGLERDVSEHAARPNASRVRAEASRRPRPRPNVAQAPPPAPQPAKKPSALQGERLRGVNPPAAGDDPAAGRDARGRGRPCVGAKVECGRCGFSIEEKNLEKHHLTETCRTNASKRERAREKQEVEEQQRRRQKAAEEARRAQVEKRRQHSPRERRVSWGRGDARRGDVDAHAEYQVIVLTCKPGKKDGTVVCDRYVVHSTGLVPAVIASALRQQHNVSTVAGEYRIDQTNPKKPTYGCASIANEEVIRQFLQAQYIADPGGVHVFMKVADVAGGPGARPGATTAPASGTWSRAELDAVRGGGGGGGESAALFGPGGRFENSLSFLEQRHRSASFAVLRRWAVLLGCGLYRDTTNPPDPQENYGALPRGLEHFARLNEPPACPRDDGRSRGGRRTESFHQGLLAGAALGSQLQHRSPSTPPWPYENHHAEPPRRRGRGQDWVKVIRQGLRDYVVGDVLQLMLNDRARPLVLDATTQRPFVTDWTYIALLDEGDGGVGPRSDRRDSSGVGGGGGGARPQKRKAEEQLRREPRDRGGVGGGRSVRARLSAETHTSPRPRHERGGTAAQLSTEELRAELARRQQAERARATAAEHERFESALRHDRERQFLERQEDCKEEDEGAPDDPRAQRPRTFTQVDGSNRRWSETSSQRAGDSSRKPLILSDSGTGTERDAWDRFRNASDDDPVDDYAPTEEDPYDEGY